ncbi:MAG: recombinase RecT [Alphaproteobacteria bacterium]
MESVSQTALVPTQAPEMMTAEQSNALMTLANNFSKASFISGEFKQKPGNIFLALGHAREIGLPPAQALQTLAVINGRVSIYGDGFLGIIQRSPQYEWHKETTKGTYPNDDYTAVCSFKRRGIDEPFVSEFSIADAKQAGKWHCKPDSPWTKYDKRMLKMRARAWAGRDAFSDALRGLSMVEEAQDIEQQADAPQQRGRSDGFTKMAPVEDAPAEKVVEVKTEVVTDGDLPGQMTLDQATAKTSSGIPVKKGDTVSFHKNGDITVQTEAPTFDEVGGVLNEWREATNAESIMTAINGFLKPAGIDKLAEATGIQKLVVIQSVIADYHKRKLILGPRIGTAETKFRSALEGLPASE